MHRKGANNQPRSLQEFAWVVVSLTFGREDNLCVNEFSVLILDRLTLLIQNSLLWKRKSFSPS